jgi:iron complex outermembrane receptor protein
MRFVPALLFVSLLCSLSAAAQQNVPNAMKAAPADETGAAPLKPTVTESVEVRTTVEPLPMAESNRSVEVIAPRDVPAVVDSPVDLLRSDASLNLQARGPEGVQADLSIRGTTFEQSLILVNGMRVNDPEAGHLNLDVSIPLDAVTRIDILHGSGSTFYGSDAIGGAVNLLTGPPVPGTTLVLRSGAGSYGSVENHLRASFTAGPLSEQVTGSRDQSDGFIADRDYASNAAASESWIKSALGATDLLFAGSDRPYGANQFYGNYNSWERTKGWVAIAQQQLGSRTAASFGYRRHTDEFVLFRDRPAVYENNHVTSSYQADLRRADEPGRNTTLSYGLEENGDTIRSNSLGRHGRNQGAGYANVSFRSLKRLSLALGARAELFSGGDSVFSPSVAGAFTVTSGLRLRASAGHGFRLPTYVDLYYSDPATVGNPALKSESSWSYEGGLDWSPSGGRVTLSGAGFTLNQNDVIDYSKRVLGTPALTNAQKWQAINIPRLDISGAEASARLRVGKRQQVQLSYTAAHSGSLPTAFISEYAYNYAAQNAVFGWTGVFGQFTAFTQLDVVQKTGHTAYPLWDVALSRNVGAVRPYLRFANLANTGYEEIVNVPMPGRTIMGGMQFIWTKR